MNIFLIVISVLVIVCWLLLSFCGERALRYLDKCDDDDYAKNLEEYLHSRHQKLHLDREQRLIDNPFSAKPRVELETRIVGIKEPIGKWTRLVTMRNLEYINNFKMLIGSKLSTKMGFWQLKVKAQSLGEGRYKGKVR